MLADLSILLQAGEIIASCSDDGTVVINGLFSAECESFTYQRPVKAVALDGRLGAGGRSKGGRQFASGGLAGQLLLNEKGWFSTKDKVLHSGEGPIHAVAWADSLLAWGNDAGVKVYDNATGQRITYIDRPKGGPRTQSAPCHLVWENASTLLIGWADFVKIALVKERQARDGIAAAKSVPPCRPPPPPSTRTRAVPPAAPPLARESAGSCGRARE